MNRAAVQQAFKRAEGSNGTLLAVGSKQSLLAFGDAGRADLGPERFVSFDKLLLGAVCRKASQGYTQARWRCKTAP